MAKIVRDIMHMHTSVKEDVTVADIAKIMTEKKIGSVIVEMKKGVGILTERDITGKIVVSAKDPRKVLAKDIMSFPVKTIGPDAEIYEACRFFSEHNFRRLPVVEGGKVIGIITTRDIVRQFVPDLIKQVYHFKDFRF